MLSRRSISRLLMSAALAQPLAACARSRRRSASVPVIDDSFARLLLQTEPEAAVLVEHPALAAMLRHARLSGRTITAAELLTDILASVPRDGSAERVLDAWAQRHDQLRGHITAAERLLPRGLGFEGVAYLVIGYDIGVAAPPDLILNVGHEKFRTAPSELGYYTTHEAHHVGFMSLRPLPPLTDLNDPMKLRSLIAYMTQLEGMGVHAAYESRAAQGMLDADPDYRIYQFHDEAQHVISRYAEVTAIASMDARLADAEVGAMLGALSSGERLWYRFGALVAWTLERERGRAALIDAIVEPRVFQQLAERLLNHG